jgi:hypothetical protein
VWEKLHCRVICAAIRDARAVSGAQPIQFSPYCAARPTVSPNYPSNPPPHPRRSRASFGHDIGIRTSARSHNWACNELPAVAFHQRGTQGATAAVVRSEDAGAAPWSAKPLARPVSRHVPFQAGEGHSRLISGECLSKLGGGSSAAGIFFLDLS